MIWTRGGTRQDVMHERSRFRISIGKNEFPRAYVQKLHDIVHPLVADAWRKGCPKHVLRASGKELQLYIGCPVQFEREAKRHYRKWLAVIAEDSALALFVESRGDSQISVLG